MAREIDDTAGGDWDEELLGPAGRDWHYEFAHRTLPQLAANQGALVRDALERRPAEFPAMVMARVAERLGLAEEEWRAHAAGITVRAAAMPYPAWIVAMPAARALTEAHFVALIAADAGMRCFTLERAAGGGTMLCEWMADGAHANLGAGPAPEAALFEAAIRRHMGWDDALARAAIAHAAAPRAGNTPGGNKVTNDMIGKDNLSRELLMALFESAYMDASLVGERSISVLESGVRVHVTVPAGRSDYITMAASWGLRKDVAREAKLDLANRVNNSFLAVRATLDDEGDVVLDMQILLPADVSKKYFVLVLKRFATIARDAVAEVFKDAVA